MRAEDRALSLETPLPIDAAVPEVLAALSGLGNVRRPPSPVVLSAPPGAGKTTRLPLALLRKGLLERGALWLLQPRRVAARASARRLAESLGETVGNRVGFRIRDEARLSPATRILVVTEGILTKRLIADPTLSGISAVMLDEFHERSRHADLALSMLREVHHTVRPDLALLVASATLDASPVTAFLTRRDAGELGGTPVEVTVPGRAFPLTIRHAERVDDRPLEIRAAGAVERALREEEGDILVFLPGASEIRRTADRLSGSEALRLARADVVPLHGDLPSRDQDRALAPGAEGRRKVILSTNVAETSLTIEGVACVIDSGRSRVLRFDPRSGLDRLVLGNASKASLAQRAGRAGRTGPGTVYRLFTREEERARLERDEPELLRTDLAPALLDILGWAARPPEEFNWFESPTASQIARGAALLRRLRALPKVGWTLTAQGRAMAALPLHPRLARVALAGAEVGLARSAATLAALLEERDILDSRAALSLTAGATPHAREEPPWDVVSRLELISSAEREVLDPARLRALDLSASSVRAVLATRDRILRALGTSHRASASVENDPETRLRKLLLSGYPDRVARRVDRTSEDLALANGPRLRLGGTPGDDSSSKLFVVLDTRAGSAQGLDRVRLASTLELEWLRDLDDGALVERTERRFDAEGEAVLLIRTLAYDGLVLDEEERPAPADEETARLLARAAAASPSRALTFDRDFEELRARLAFLSRTIPELGLGAIDERALATELSIGRVRFEELRRIRLADHVLSSLSFEGKRALDANAPREMRVPSGRTLPITYRDAATPFLAVKLQELFGLRETPRLAGGRIPLVLHLLSPAGRPVQVTSDLESFWRTTYAAVRKELRGRYPKHPWPEDPRTAVPDHRPKKRLAGRH